MERNNFFLLQRACFHPRTLSSITRLNHSALSSSEKSNIIAAVWVRNSLASIDIADDLALSLWGICSVLDPRHCKVQIMKESADILAIHMVFLCLIVFNPMSSLLLFMSLTRGLWIGLAFRRMICGFIMCAMAADAPLPQGARRSNAAMLGPSHETVLAEIIMSWHDYHMIIIWLCSYACFFFKKKKSHASRVIEGNNHLFCNFGVQLQRCVARTD